MEETGTQAAPARAFKPVNLKKNSHQYLTKPFPVFTAEARGECWFNVLLCFGSDLCTVFRLE